MEGFDAHTLIRDYGLWGLGAAAFLAATLIPVSSEAVLILAIKAGLGVGPSLVAASIGNCAACLLNYALGRWIYTLLGRTPASKSVDRATVRIRRHGWWALLLSWLPIIGDPLTVAAGIARLSLPLFASVVCGLRVARYVAILALLN